MRTAVLRLFLVVALACSLQAQEAGQNDSGQKNAGHQETGKNMDTSMTGMNMATPSASSLSMPSPHAGSGTGWQPASVPMNLWMTTRGQWDLMAHAVLFLTYNQQGGPRGVGKVQSSNYFMAMEQHKLWTGTLLFRQMFSAELVTAPTPGFPELFQTGETYDGEPLVDYQHPHNLFGELSVLYTLPLSKSERVLWEIYGGPSAEPALGPVAYIHRQSASENPSAPLSHHLQDSTHTSFGVVTTGLIFNPYKTHFIVEGSVFNAREPNEDRWSIQLAPLDSWSFRVSAAPARNWVAQYSYGRLEHPEELEPGTERRQSASVEYNRPFAEGNWASSLIWGRKRKELDGTILNSYLFESTVNFLRRNYGFTRLELVDKDELFPEAETHPSYRIGAYTFGGVRDLIQNRHWQLGLGADVTFYSKPAVLDPVYGDNPVSFHVFLRVRPGLSEHKH